MLGSRQFFVRLQFSVIFLKKLHRKTPFGEADARHKAKPLLEFKWYNSSLLSGCSFKSGQHKVATAASSVYQQWPAQCTDSGHLSAKTVDISA